MKISTILRRACEWSERHPRFAIWYVLQQVCRDSDAQRASAFVTERFGVFNFDHPDDKPARSLFLGLAAAIAESDGL